MVGMNSILGSLGAGEGEEDKVKRVDLVSVDHGAFISNITNMRPITLHIMKMLLDHQVPVVVTKFIKQGKRWCSGEVRNGIKPGLIAINIMVKNTWIPINITGKDDMRYAFPFLICIRA